MKNQGKIVSNLWIRPVTIVKIQKTNTIRKNLTVILTCTAILSSQREKILRPNC